MSRLGVAAFRGKLTQLLMDQMQLARINWSPGVLQSGSAPTGTWVFGLPISAGGSLHVRRRPSRAGELLVATSRDDVGFTATGPTDMMVIVLPTPMIDGLTYCR